jgi:hypothetical protein
MSESPDSAPAAPSSSDDERQSSPLGIEINNEMEKDVTLIRVSEGDGGACCRAWKRCCCCCCMRPACVAGVSRQCLFSVFSKPPCHTPDLDPASMPIPRLHTRRWRAAAMVTPCWLPWAPPSISLASPWPQPHRSARVSQSVRELRAACGDVRGARGWPAAAARPTHPPAAGCALMSPPTGLIPAIHHACRCRCCTCCTPPAHLDTAGE